MTAGPLPHNEEAEASVLGAVLLTESALDRLDGLRPEDFYRPRNVFVFQAMLAVARNGRAVDALTVTAELERRGQLDKAGGSAHVHSLPAVVPAVGAVADYARIVRETARERRTLEAARQLEGKTGAEFERAAGELRAALAERDASEGMRTREVDWQRVRPTRWLWERRIPLGLLSLLVGEEGVGKGTLLAWVIARATRGELPGDLHGKPTRVLIVGDEDAFEPVWVPRLHAAGADHALLRTLDDDEHLADIAESADALGKAVEREEAGLVLLDALIDHIPGGADGSAVYNPKNIRQMLVPVRRMAAERGVAVLGALHPIKGRPHNFRDLIGGSHQFNAVSRSSLLLAEDPEDDTRRVLVRGKGNHSAAPRSFEFRLAPCNFELAGHGFEMPLVTDEGEEERTVRDLLAAAGPDSPTRDRLAQDLLDELTDEPQGLGDLARAVGRERTDGTVRRALAKLAEDGYAEKDREGKWCRRR